MSSEISVFVPGMEMVVNVARQPSHWSTPSGSAWRFRPVTGQSSWGVANAAPFCIPGHQYPDDFSRSLPTLIHNKFVFFLAEWEQRLS